MAFYVAQFQMTFKIQTIHQPDGFGPFEYKTRLVFRSLLYLDVSDIWVSSIGIPYVNALK